MKKKSVITLAAATLFGLSLGFSEEVSADQHLTTEQYTVQPGDTLYEIAMKKGVNVPMLESSNPHITNPDVIYSGQNITIPFSGPGEPSRDSDKYYVREADTLSGIARRRGSSVSDIVAANDLADPDFIVVDQMLIIPGTATEDPSKPLPPTPTDYTVKEGDTLSEIGEMYGLTAETIFNSNRLAVSDPDLIYPGQVLIIP